MAFCVNSTAATIAQSNLSTTSNDSTGNELTAAATTDMGFDVPIIALLYRKIAIVYMKQRRHRQLRRRAKQDLANKHGEAPKTADQAHRTGSSSLGGDENVPRTTTQVSSQIDVINSVALFPLSSSSIAKGDTARDDGCSHALVSHLTVDERVSFSLGDMFLTQRKYNSAMQEYQKIHDDR